MNWYILIGITCLVILIIMCFLLRDQRETFKATTPDIRAACLFAVSNFDADDYRTVKDNSTDIPFFIINNGPLNEEVKKTEKLPNVKVSARENSGWDLAAWKYGIEKYGNELSSYDYVILANNSCIYANNWRELLVGAIGYDMYGHLNKDITENDRYYLMSWFIIVSKKLFNSSSFREYFNSLNPMDRDYCINNHEIRFTDYFKNKGFKIGMFAYEGKFGAVNGVLKKKERTAERTKYLNEWMDEYKPKYTYHQ